MSFDQWLFKYVPVDKVLHFFAGGFIVGCLLPIIHAWSVVISLLIGVIKEIVDHVTVDRADPYDVIATVVGGFTVYETTVLGLYLKHLLH